jgi:hypothetical protein
MDKAVLAGLGIGYVSQGAKLVCSLPRFNTATKPWDAARAQVLVKLHLRPVNPADVVSIRGLYAGYAATLKPCQIVTCPRLCIVLYVVAWCLLRAHLLANRSFKPETYPAVPGLEGVGTVVKNGPRTSKLKVSSPPRSDAHSTC